MARILINGVEVAINGDPVLINGDDEPATGTRPFHKESRMGVVPGWQTTRTPVPTRQAPIGSPSSNWPRKGSRTL